MDSECEILLSGLYSVPANGVHTNVLGLFQWVELCAAMDLHNCSVADRFSIFFSFSVVECDDQRSVKLKFSVYNTVRQNKVNFLTEQTADMG